MGKYTLVGVFLAIMLFLISVVMVNHASNTQSMQEIDIGIRTALIGNMRHNDSNAGATDYGMRAKDVVTVITKEVADKQPVLKKTTTIDFKFFTDEKGNDFVSYDTAVNNNMVIKSVQYKVNRYNTSDVTEKNGEIIVKDGAEAETSTENRIILSKLM